MKFVYKVQREAVARTVYVGRMCGWDVGWDV